jgi:molybdopterin-guanine dinucleotide biosynthesis protein A
VFTHKDALKDKASFVHFRYQLLDMSMESENVLSQSDKHQPFSVVILTGGHSERFGCDKARLDFNGQSLIQGAVASLMAVSDDIICVARSEQEIGVTGAQVIYDLPGASGVLPALSAGLERTKYRWSFVMGCDMPFVSLPLVRYLFTLVDGFDIVVPHLVIGIEPLHAFYHRRVQGALTRAIVDGRKRVVSFYEDVRVRKVDEAELRLYDPHLRSFFNINTPADLDQADKWLKEGV